MHIVAAKGIAFGEALKPEFEEQKRDRREFVPDKKPDTSFLEGISANDAQGLKDKAGELLDLKDGNIFKVRNVILLQWLS